MYNWNTLNIKVFKKLLGVQLSKKEIDDLVMGVPDKIEKVLRMAQERITLVKSQKKTF